MSRIKSSLALPPRMDESLSLLMDEGWDKERLTKGHFGWSRNAYFGALSGPSSERWYNGRTILSVKVRNL